MVARQRFGLAEWLIAAVLLFVSLSGPWLTLILPAAAVFAIQDRRRSVRWGAWLTALAVGTIMFSTAVGQLHVLIAVLSIGMAIVAVRQGLHSATAGRLAGPAIGGAALGMGVGLLVSKPAWSAWEEGLSRGLAEAGERSLERYRSLGVLEGESMNALEGMTGWLGEWLVELWPAMVALTLWLGVWLGYRALSRWGRVETQLRQRLLREPFSWFKLADGVIWLPIVGMAAIWLPFEAAGRAGANALAVAAVLYAIQGLAIVVWWMGRRGVGAGLRVLSLAVVALLAAPLLAGVALALGLADHWVGWREYPATDRTESA